MKKLIFAFSLFCFFSCASTNQYVEFTDHKNLDSENARIYLIRKNNFASAVVMKVYENEEIIGKLGPSSYLCWDIEAGNEIKIKSKSENKEYFTIKPQPGKSYYIRQKVKLGWVIPRNSLELIGEEEALASIEKINLPKVKYID